MSGHAGEIKKADIYRHRKHFGVNLGGWLVFEEWMNGDLYGLGENHELALQTKCLDDADLRERRIAHIKNYISDKDLDALALAGVTSVRIPIGYWCLPDAKAVQDTPWQDLWQDNQALSSDVTLWDHILATIQKLQDRDIGVFIQYHGAPGSQNGEQHSGQVVQPPGLYGHDGHEKAFIEGLKVLARETKSIANVFAIGILNEPSAHARLHDLTRSAVMAIRQIDPEIVIVISDCWAPEAWMKFVEDDKALNEFVKIHDEDKDPKYGPIWLDHHFYRCHAAADQAKSPAQHCAELVPASKDAPAGAFWTLMSHAINLESIARPQFVIGEWSPTIHHSSPDGQAAVEAEFAQRAYRLFSELTVGHFYWSFRHHWQGGRETPNTWHWDEMRSAGSLPAPYSPAKTDRNVSQLKSRRDELFRELRRQHENYWKEHSTSEIYQSGLEAGFDDSLEFAEHGANGSLLHLSAPWLASRFQTRGLGRARGHMWEFIHGYKKAHAIVLKYIYDWPDCLVSGKQGNPEPERSRELDDEELRRA